MGVGRLPGWTGRIRPFRDNPDFELPVVWYAVPPGTPPGPVSCFVTRFDEDRERWAAGGVGTAYRSLKPYFGPRPPFQLTPLVGSADEWANGLLYSDYVAAAGAGAPPCFDVAAFLPGGRIRAVETSQLGAVGGPSLRLWWGCANCPGGTYLVGLLLVGGVADGTHSAAAVNGLFTLGNVGSCTWRSGTFVVFGTTSARWQVTIQPGGTTLRLQKGPTFVNNFAVWSAVPPLACREPIHYDGADATTTVDFDWSAATADWSLPGP